MAERVLSVRLRAITDAYERGMARAAAATEQMVGRVDRISNLGESMTSVGSSLTMGLTVPIAAVGTVAAKSAIDFESAWAGVTKTVDGTTQQLSGLRQGIIDMASTIPATREEIAGVAATAGQLGIATDNVLGFTRVMIDLGESTDLSSEQAATSLAQLANITQMPQTQFSNLGSSVVALGNNMATTESKIVDMAQRIASAGSQVGLSEAQILGFSAALSSVGIEAEAGGTAMSRVLITIAQAVDGGGAMLEEFARIAGMSADEFARAFRQSPAEAITAFIQGMGRLEQSGESMFSVMETLSLGDVRVGNAVRSMAGAGDLLTRSIDLSTAAWTENVALSDEAGKRYATTESRLRMAANQATDLARKTGEALVPALVAVMNTLEPVVSGLGGLVEAASRAPRPIQLVGGSIAAIALASGPAIWALGKLAGLYAPVVAGFQKMIGAVQGFQLQLHLASMSGISTSSALLQMLGPQAAVIAALAALAAGFYAMKRASDEAEKSHRSAGEAAMALGESAGLTLRDLEGMGAGAEEAVGSIEAFRQKNQDAIATLKALRSETDQQAYIAQVGFELVQRGATPEQAMQQVQQLADAAGVTVPVTLTVENIGDFQAQVDAAIAAGRRIESVGAITNWSGARKELENVGAAAANAFKTDDVAGFVAILGSMEDQLGDNLSAVNILADEGMKGLGDGFGFSLDKGQNLVDVLDQIRSGNTTALPEQVAMVDAIWKTAEGMEGGVTAGNLYAAAMQFQGLSAEQAKDKIAATGVSVENFSEQNYEAEQTTADFAAQLEKMAALARMSTLDLDAAAQAAQAYAESIERSTNLDDELSAGLQAGRANLALAEGITGRKRLADASKEAAKEEKKAADAADELSRAVSNLDPKLTAAGIAMGSLEAAAEAFRKAMDDSSWVDDQAEAALSLADAYRNFRRNMRALPADLDLADMAMGGLSKRQRQAVRDVIALGGAVKDYLATLLESGRSEGEVAAEAARLREEYAAQLRQIGLNEEQVQKYLQVLNLTPDQVTTAIRLSGEEAARFQLQAYLQLLQGKIPGEVASSVIAKIEAGDISGAAGQLANWAKTNPVTIDVTPKVDEDSGYQEKVQEIQDSLWNLPQDFDPLTAALGGYDDAAMSALEALQRLGDGYQNYIGKLIEGDTPDEEVIRQTGIIRENLLRQLADYGIVGEAAQRYVDLLGLSEDQINTAITVSGDAEATAKVQAFLEVASLIGAPREIQIEVAKAQIEGRLGDAGNLISTWWEDQKDGVIDNPLVAQILGDNSDAQADVDALREQFPMLADLIVEGDTDPARDDVDRMLEYVEGLRPIITVGLSLAAGAGKALGEQVANAANRIAISGAVANLPTQRPNGDAWGTPLDGPAGGFDGDPSTPYAIGGLVVGPGGPTDDKIPARLSAGEFVVRADAVRKVGVQFLERLNRGELSWMQPGKVYNPELSPRFQDWQRNRGGPDWMEPGKVYTPESSPKFQDWVRQNRPLDGQVFGSIAEAQQALAQDLRRRAGEQVDRKALSATRGGFNDARIVAALDNLSRQVAGLDAGISIDKVVMPTPEPSRAGANLVEAASTTARAARRG